MNGLNCLLRAAAVAAAADAVVASPEAAAAGPGWVQSSQLSRCLANLGQTISFSPQNFSFFLPLSLSLSLSPFIQTISEEWKKKKKKKKKKL